MIVAFAALFGLYAWLQIRALRRLKGIRFILALLCLAFVVVAIAVALAGSAAGSNLSPVLLVYALPVVVSMLAGLLLSDRIRPTPRTSRDR